MSRHPCPTKKRGYGNQETAIAAAIRVSRHLGPLRVCDCPHCGALHLTRLHHWIER